MPYTQNHMFFLSFLFTKSAKLTHGRPKYLKANKFVNAFAHYRPRGAHKFLWGYNSRNDAIYDSKNELVVDVKLDRLTRQLRTGKLKKLIAFFFAKFLFLTFNFVPSSLLEREKTSK